MSQGENLSVTGEGDMYALSTGNLPSAGMPRNRVGSITPCPDMTSVVNHEHNALKNFFLF